jgi:hypothetical protein
LWVPQPGWADDDETAQPQQAAAAEDAVAADSEVELDGASVPVAEEDSVVVEAVGLGAGGIHAAGGPEAGAPDPLEDSVDEELPPPPEGSGQSVTITSNEGMAVFDPLGDVTGTNLQPLNEGSFTQPEHGAVELTSDGGLSYFPEEDWEGSTSFSVEVCDEYDQCATLVYDVNVELSDTSSGSGAAKGAAVRKLAYTGTDWVEPMALGLSVHSARRSADDSQTPPSL